MVNEECKQALTIIQERNKLNKGELHLPEISASLGVAMKQIVSTQRQFEMKRFFESYPILTGANEAYHRLLRRKPVTWGTLFSSQLDNVGELNRNLVGLIYVTSGDFKSLQQSLIARIDAAKGNLHKYKSTRESIPQLKADYEDGGLKNLEFNPEDETHYDLLKKELLAEDKLLEGIGSVSLGKKVHERDLENIEFLKRHLLIYRGTIHTAKDLALTTRQMCDTLGELRRVYEMTSATKDCLEQVYAGVSHLKGYTDSLQELYQKTDETLEQIASTPNPLKLSGDSLTGIASRGINRLLPNES